MRNSGTIDDTNCVQASMAQDTKTSTKKAEYNEKHKYNEGDVATGSNNEGNTQRSNFKSYKCGR